jgi:hypothetical protein
MAKEIRTLTVLYHTKLKNHEIQLFRGAVLKSLGNKANVLYPYNSKHHHCHR